MSRYCEQDMSAAQSTRLESELQALRAQGFRLEDVMAEEDMTMLVTFFDERNNCTVQVEAESLTMACVTMQSRDATLRVDGVYYSRFAFARLHERLKSAKSSDARAEA